MSSTPVAVLDDYVDIAPQYLSAVPGVILTYFPDTIIPSTPADLSALATRLAPFPIILCMRERTPFQAPLLSQLPNLKLLLTTGVRNKGIDLDAARSHGIVVAGTTGIRDLPSKHSGLPSISKDYDATNQQTFALLLSLASRIPTDNAALRTPGRPSAAWQSGLGFSLGDKTFGCVGLGRLGAKAARTAVLGFGMQVVAWSASLQQERADAAAAEMGLPVGAIRAVSKEELLRTADVVSIHYVLSERSRGLIGREELGLMKKGAVLVNTSRGPIVDEAALIEVLKEGRIRGAALDVFETEPLQADSPWRTSEFKSEVVLSPHMGYGVEEMMHRWYAEQADTLEKWLKGIEIPEVMN